MSMRALLVAVVLGGAAAAGCGGPGHVNFDHDRCLYDGRVATLDEVERLETEIGQRVVGRQPIYVAVTLAVILLAGASHIEKLGMLLFAARHRETRGLGERIRLALDRYRVHPVRYFAIVLSTLALLCVAGGLYLYLDADKRASERALGQLQFCHLAIKTALEQSTLDEERHNLETIRGTVGDIKTLVDTLPPDEQRKAEQLLGQMHAAIGNQDRLLARSNAITATVQARSSEIQKELATLRQLPDGVERVGAAVRRLSDELRAVDASVGRADVHAPLAELARRVDALPRCGDEKLPGGKTIAETLAALAARPPPTCTCRCEPPPATGHAPVRSPPDGG